MVDRLRKQGRVDEGRKGEVRIYKQP